MLAAEHRLRDSDTFRRAVRSGRRAGGAAVVTHVLASAPHDDQVPREPTRVGFIVSKAVGNAVVRNRVKRRLRHLIKDRLAALPAGSIVVVRALPGAADCTSSELGAEIDRCLLKAARRAPRVEARAGATS